LSSVALGGKPVVLPRWPSAFLSLLACLAALSLLQGFLDIVLPTLTGGQPFATLFGMTRAFGPVFFALYVFVHNLGLACLVPGFGFVAVWFEKRKANRGVIGALLAGSVVLSLLVGFEFIVQARERFDLALTLPLFALEATGVLVLAIPAARMLRGFVPTPHYDWSLVAPMRALSGRLVASCALLAAAALVETYAVLLA
jgi:hypothetical protein